MRVAAVAAPFDRELEADLRRVETILARCRTRGVDLVVFPEAALGGYLASLQADDQPSTPPALDIGGPEMRRLAGAAGDTVVCIGFCEQDGSTRYNTVACLTGDGILARHRKVHQPLEESTFYDSGAEFAAFDSPVGRMGMMICYDKAFPESARTLALDGAQIIACVSAWPAARTARVDDIAQDRWLRRFDLFDRARALENQVLWVSANQSGTFGSLRFVASAKVVDAGGDVLATTGVEAGIAEADVDVDQMLSTARRSMFNLRDRRPDHYRLYEPAAAAGG